MDWRIGAGRNCFFLSLQIYYDSFQGDDESMLEGKASEGSVSCPASSTQHPDPASSIPSSCRCLPPQQEALPRTEHVQGVRSVPQDNQPPRAQMTRSSRTTPRAIGGHQDGTGRSPPLARSQVLCRYSQARRQRWGDRPLDLASDTARWAQDTRCCSPDTLTVHSCFDRFFFQMIQFRVHGS